MTTSNTDSLQELVNRPINKHHRYLIRNNAGRKIVGSTNDLSLTLPVGYTHIDTIGEDDLGLGIDAYLRAQGTKVMTYTAESETDSLMALAERCEAATGPDRELDRAVARTLGWHRVEPRFSRNKHGAWISSEDFIGVMSDGSPILDSLHGTVMHRDVPAYTASLDVAMTLVPQPGKWSITSANDKWQSWVWLADGTPPNWREAATPALVLIAAALRARAQGTKS